MDQLQLQRYCCRRMVMTHVDLIEKLLRYVFRSFHRATTDHSQLQSGRKGDVQAVTAAGTVWLRRHDGPWNEVDEPWHAIPPMDKARSNLLSGLRAAASMLSAMAEAAPNDLENRRCMM
jgi:hypothetical protein